MSLYRRVVLLSLLGMSSGAQSASHEQIMQIYNSGSVGSVIKCQAHMDVKSGDGTISVQIMSVMTITGRQFHHLYYDSAITYSIVNAEKPYMYVSVSAEENIREEQRKIRSELDLSTLRVDFLEILKWRIQCVNFFGNNVLRTLIIQILPLVNRRAIRSGNIAKILFLASFFRLVRRWRNAEGLGNGSSCRPDKRSVTTH